MNKDNKNHHNMTTRSKSENIENKNISMDNITEIIDSNEEIDDHGNIKDFIVYDGDTSDKMAMDELREILYGIKASKKKIKKNKRKKNSGNLKNPMGDMFVNYLILKATEKVTMMILSGFNYEDFLFKQNRR